MVKIKDVYLSPFLYHSPLVDLYWESIIKEIRVEGENINPDIYLEGNSCDLINVRNLIEAWFKMSKKKITIHRSSLREHWIG
ncbi:MAG: hypothetical protein DRP38_01805 [Thermotogae bacterium]|nr:MAG: hypothetical protein DRP38_01805 [Thermotogota bacterium]